MSFNLQQQLADHGPMSALVGGMILLGSLINQNATDTSPIYPKDSWCINATTTTLSMEQLLLTGMPRELGVATIVVVVIFPLIPMLINSQTKTWNDFKVDILKCHIVGQTSAFGVSELLRHFLISPEPAFLQKCNLTIAECKSGLPSTCNSFDTLHHFPDKTCCIIGASIVTFLATLYFWNRINKSGKSIYEAHSMQQCFLIFAQIVCITLILAYLYFLYNSFDGAQIYGVFIGALLQLMVILSTLPKK